MLAIALLSVMFVAPTEGSPQEQAATYAAAGEAHLERAAVPGDRQLDEFDDAHRNFDLAYLTADDTGHLCRALHVAELALTRVTFPDAQARLSWEEVKRDDLGRLRKHAAETRRANCRYAANGEPQRPRVAILTDDDFSPRVGPHTNSPADGGRVSISLPVPTPTTRRRWNTQTAAGAILTGTGVGLIGLLAGAVGLQVRNAEKLRDIASNADAAGELADADRDRAAKIHADSLQIRNVAIGVGVAGAASLAAGVALLATRKKTSRAVAVMPYGGPLGGGAVLRLRF